MAPLVQKLARMIGIQSGSARQARVTAPMTFGDRDAATGTLGRYLVLDLIATGGMGGVYLAEDGFGRRYALKLLDAQFTTHPEIVQRLAAERVVSERAAHPGLVRVHEFVAADGHQPYIVMELVDGETLASLLDRGRFELGAIAAIGAQLAEALGAMHRAGIAHCDVKPDNVMVVYEQGLAGWPALKLGDFGVARFLDQPADEMSIAGTPPYMAPEQWSGDVQAKTDIYALGCTLYELVTGAPPFEGSLAEMMNAHVDRLPARPSTRRPGVPAALDRLVMRMLAKDPAMRPTPAELAAELAELAYAMPPSDELTLYPCVA